MSREELLALVSAQAGTIESLIARLDALEGENVELKRRFGSELAQLVEATVLR